MITVGVTVFRGSAKMSVMLCCISCDEINDDGDVLYCKAGAFNKVILSPGASTDENWKSMDKDDSDSHTH